MFKSSELFIKEVKFMNVFRRRNPNIQLMFTRIGFLQQNEKAQNMISKIITGREFLFSDIHMYVCIRFISVKVLGRYFTKH